MKIVVATEGGLDGNAATHFAHCSHFVVFEEEDGRMKNTEIVENPYFKEHIPGVIPKFVKSLGADVLITDGIGPSAIALFGKMNIEVLYGVKGKARDLAERYLEGKLKPNENSCNH
ncbi:MAG: NifB/NifX family molybdenum-iron cluster-binding protein [Candidatus Micrarchaeota archaeon]